MKDRILKWLSDIVRVMSILLIAFCVFGAIISFIAKDADKDRQIECLQRQVDSLNHELRIYQIVKQHKDVTNE